MIKIEKLNKSYSIKTHSGKEIGSFQLDSDGSYYFWETSHMRGCWDSDTLKSIADKLDEVNKPFNEEVSNFFRNNDIIKFGSSNSFITQDHNIAIQGTTTGSYEILPYTNDAEFLNSFWEYFDGKCLEGSLEYCVNLVKDYYESE